ncbi:ketoacyl-ACP synthase III family protein [Nocardia tengchongensis]|uniref:ketoacyl-ACP synthase III family protein n=1 Tax=Nocardia tengchongensis TaxID=2055889 RepID=UPI0036B67567
MRWNDIYLAGVGAYLPEARETALEAIASGKYTEKAHEANGIPSVRVAGDDESGPVMAAAAGREAIAMSGVAADEVDLVLHACVSHQGRDFWSPASFVQTETGCTAARSAIEIRQGSNGAFAGLELAASHLTAQSGATAALVTAGDAFREPYINRWTSDDQTVFGDGACAALLSTTKGFARIITTVSGSEPALEPVYRGQEPWTVAPFLDQQPVDLTARKDQWLQRDEDAYDDALALISENFDKVLSQALDEADMKLQDAEWVVHATLIKPLVEWGFRKQLGLDPARTTYDWGLDLGHMGTCDQLIGLHRLVTTGVVKPGDRLVTWSAGIGFVWTAMILEFI